MMNDFKPAGNRGDLFGQEPQIAGGPSNPPNTNTGPQPAQPQPQAQVRPSAPVAAASPAAARAAAAPAPPQPTQPAPSSNGFGNGGPSSNDPGNDNGYDEPKLPWYRKLSQRQWLIFGGVLLIVVGGAVFALSRSDGKDQTVVTTQKTKPAPPPEPILSPLTGIEVSDENAKRTVTGVMIENSTFARPQSGLTQAGVVYEAIAEYGITRFLALYQETAPANLGPVRSVRPYYVDWARAFDAPIAHVGGSPDALKKIKAEGVKDLDQFYNSSAYRRIASREAPHNMYTNMAALNKVEANKGWNTSSFNGFARKKAAEVKPLPASDGTTPQPNAARRVAIAISGPTYNTNYVYDQASNSYKRFMAGAPHIDADTKAQIAPKVVIGLATPYGLEADGYHSKYQITGSGAAFVFQSGTVTQVVWKRDSGASQYTFSDATTGKPFKLDPGQTWITVVGNPGAITHSAQ